MPEHAAVNVDTIRRGPQGLSAAGSVASRLLQSGFNVNSLRTNATLRIREWILYDTAVINVALKRLVGVADLLNAGLRYEVPDALGITRIEWEKLSRMDAPIVSMSGVEEAATTRQEYAVDSVPLPVIHTNFAINIRVLEASRRLGTPLDVTQAESAARRVSEQIETMLFSGSTVLGSNTPIYGYTTFPSRNTGSVTASWATATGTQIITDTLAMITALVGQNMYGPYMLYVPAATYVAFGNDYKTTATAQSDRTIMERVLAIPGILGVRPSKDLLTTNVLMVQMTSNVVDEIDGMQPTMVEWETQGGMVVNFKILAIMVPRMKVDYESQCGIAHYS